jgi:hypothetical protein
MSLVTSATVAITRQANISALQTFHIIIPKFFAIHEDQSVEQGINHLVPLNTVLVLLLFLLGTTAYSSSSSSCLYRKRDLNDFPTRYLGGFVKIWSREKAREPCCPPICGFLVRLGALLLQTHAKNLRFLGFCLRFGRVSDGG